MTTHIVMLAILAHCPYFPEAGLLADVQAIAATVYFQVALRRVVRCRLYGRVCRLTENPWRNWSTDSFYRTRSFVALFTSALHPRHADFALLCCFFKICLDSFRSSLPNSQVSWLRQLVAGLSERRPWFNRRPVLLRFVEHKVALGQPVLPVLRFCLSVSFRQCATLVQSSVTMVLGVWKMEAWLLVGVWRMEAWLLARRKIYIFFKASGRVQVKNCLLFHGTVPGVKRPEQKVCQVHVRTSGPSEAMLD